MGLGLATAAPVILAGAAKAAATPDRSAWNALLRELKTVEAQLEVSRKRWDAAEARYEAMRPDRDTSIDFKTLGFLYTLDRNATARTLNLEEDWREFLKAEGKLWWVPNPEAITAKHRAALDSIQRFRDLEKEADQRSGFEEANDVFDALVERQCELHSLLVKMPAPDTEALLWKIEHLFSEAESWEPEYTAQTFSDARRLLSHGRA
jgi:hypothetical protein